MSPTNKEETVNENPDVPGQAQSASTGDAAAKAQSAATGEVAASAAQSATAGRGYRKVRQGRVVSDKMDKTVVVSVEDRFKHPLYGKVIRRASKLKAHDEQNDAAIGDRVLVMETRPLSATKRWRVVEIIEKAK